MSDITVVSYSEIKRWRFCQQSHYFNYAEGIIPQKKPKPLKMGNIIHKLVETWAKGEDYKAILSEVEEEYKNMFEEEREFYGDLPKAAARITDGYLKRYGKELKSYRLVESSFGPIPLTRLTSFKMRIDRVLRTKNGLLLCETKTCRKIPEEGIRIWDLQTILYVWALRKLGHKITGILWDYVRTKPPTIPQVLKNGELSKRADIDTDYETYKGAITEAGLSTKNYTSLLKSLRTGKDRFFRRIILPVNENMILPVLQGAKRSSLEIHHLRNNPVRNVSGFTCPRCFYASLCYAQLRGLDDEYIRKNEYMDKEEEIEYGEEVDSEEG